MDVLEQLLSMPNVVLCLAIVGLVWIQRKISELSFKKLTEKGTKLNKLWTELLIPLAPIGTGASLMAIPQMPAPEMFAESTLTRMVFGVFLGLMSGLVYRLVKKNLLERMGKEEEKSEYIEE